MDKSFFIGIAVGAVLIVVIGVGLYLLLANSGAPEKTTYTTFSDGNFSVLVPEWKGAKENQGGVAFEAKSGGRIAKVEKIEDEQTWKEYKAFKEMIANQTDSTEKVFEDLRMKMSYKTKVNGQEYTASKRFLNCDSKTFIATYFCAVGRCAEEEKDKILDSMFCKEESRSGAVVETSIGKNFGFNDAELVDFINSNPYFTGILKDFSLVNIVFESSAGNQEANAEISGGKITKLLNGLNKNAKVTVWLPLEETKAIVEKNAQGQTPGTLDLLAFAAKMRTDPPELKEKMIQKAMGG